MFRIRYALVAAAVVVVVAIGVTACSSSPSSSGASAGGTSSGTASTANSGQPIQITVLGTFVATGVDWRDAYAAVQAKADQVNAAGGIHGRKIQVTVCDDQLNPNQATTCARNAVSSGAVAVISTTESNGFGTQTLPVLAAAGIPDVGEPAVVSADWSSGNVFPLDPGEPAQYAGVALALKRAGCTKAGSLQFPVSAAAAAAADLAVAMKGVDGEVVKNIPTALTQDTYAPQVAQLIAAGAQCIVPMVQPGEVPKVLNAIQQSGKHLMVAGVTAAFSLRLLQSLGSEANGILLAGASYLPTDTSVPAVKQMLAAMKKYTPQIPVTDSWAPSAWGAANLLFSSILPSISGPITTASVTNALEHAGDLPVGTYAPYTFSASAPNKQYPRLMNTGILLWQVKGTTPELMSNQFINIYKAVKF
jgi:ABC-type branched-subunit amino acid transport system substrate-binding protein